MASEVSSTLSGVVQSGFAQLKLQQARREAERAEQTARALGEQARAAQSDADRAQDNARQLSIRSDQAEGRAGQARAGLAAIRSATEATNWLGAVADRTAKQQNSAPVEGSIADPPAPTSSSAAAPNAVSERGQSVNPQGQVVGRVVSTTA